jgi:hypothetical protein
MLLAFMCLPCGLGALAHATEPGLGAWAASDPKPLLEQLPGRYQGSNNEKQPGVCLATLLDAQNQVVGFIEAGAVHLSYNSATGTLETLWATGDSATAEYSGSLPESRRLTLTLNGFPAQNRTETIRAKLVLSTTGNSSPVVSVERQLTVDDRCARRVTGSPRRSGFAGLLQWLAQ